MVRIAISQAAFAAIAKTFALEAAGQVTRAGTRYEAGV
jgi:hypothetical protein